MQEKFTSPRGRAVECPGEQSCFVRLADGGGHSNGHFIAWEVAKVLWAAANIHDAVRLSGRGPVALDQRLECDPIAILGEFELDVVQFIALGAACRGVSAFNTRYAGFVQESSRIVSWLLYSMRPSSEEIESLHLEFFGYVLRGFLGLRFKPDLSREDTEYESHDNLTQFLGCLTLLSLDDVEEREPLHRDEGGGSLQTFVMPLFWMV